MTYNPAIPQAGDTLALSQQSLLINFQEANTIFGADHVNFTAPAVANRGKHNWTKYVLQAVAPVAAGTDCIMYTQTVGGFSKLHYQRGGAAAFVLVGSSVPVVGPVGCTVLPGGLLLQWGIQAGVPVGIGPAIGFPVAFGGGLVAPYSIVCTLLQLNPPTTVRVINVLSGSVLPGSFQTDIKTTGGGAGVHQIYWMAIGPE